MAWLVWHGVVGVAWCGLRGIVGVAWCDVVWLGVVV